MIDKAEDQAITEARANALRLFNELRELPYRDQAWFDSFLRRVDPDWWLPECFTAWPFTPEHKLFRPRDVPASKLSDTHSAVCAMTSGRCICAEFPDE